MMNAMVANHHLAAPAPAPLPNLDILGAINSIKKDTNLNKIHLNQPLIDLFLRKKTTKPTTKEARSIKTTKKTTKDDTSLVDVISIIIQIIIYIFELLTGRDPNPDSSTPAPHKPGYIPKCGSFNCEPCGITAFEPDIAKIVGGQEARSHSWPAQVFVLFSYTNYLYLNGSSDPVYVSQSFQCGGTLINPDTIMTAAHCINTRLTVEDNQGNEHQIEIPIDPEHYQVWLGYHDLFDNSDGFGIKMRAKFVTIHPNYSPERTESLQNDIALIKLIDKVVLNEAIQVACLPNPLNPFYPTQYGEPVYLSGWGTTSQGGSTSNVLLNVKLTLYNSSLCEPILPSVPQNPQTQICAGNYEGGQDSCQGDSGGGLYFQDTVNDSKKFIAVGVVSYGDGCAQPRKPGLYTRVSAYMNWINTTVFDLL